MRNLTFTGLLAGIGVLCMAAPAYACPTWHTLTNGTTADATQVMDNFNNVLQCPDFTGSVGVGTATPDTSRAITLDSPNNYAGIMFRVNGTNMGLIEQESTGNVYYDTYSDMYLRPGALSGNSSWVILKSNGYVGIGTSSPSYPLYVNGTAYASGAAGALSDARHKKNVARLADGALGIIARLRPVTFSWKQPKDDGMKGTQMGFIAQDVEQVLPTAVLTANDVEKTKGLKYNEIVAVLTKAVQELKLAGDATAAENRKLKASNERQAAMLAELQRQVAALDSGPKGAPSEVSVLRRVALAVGWR